MTPSEARVGARVLVRTWVQRDTARRHAFTGGDPFSTCGHVARKESEFLRAPREGDEWCQHCARQVLLLAGGRGCPVCSRSVELRSNGTIKRHPVGVRPGAECAGTEQRPVRVFLEVPDGSL